MSIEAKEYGLDLFDFLNEQTDEVDNDLLPTPEELPEESDRDHSNGALFTEEEISPWVVEWQNMPEYNVKDLSPKYQVLVSFASASDVEEFSKLIGQTINTNGGRQLKSVWYPEQEITRYMNKRYIEL